MKISVMRNKTGHVKLPWLVFGTVDNKSTAFSNVNSSTEIEGTYWNYNALDPTEHNKNVFFIAGEGEVANPSDIYDPDTARLLGIGTAQAVNTSHKVRGQVVDHQGISVISGLYTYPQVMILGEDNLFFFVRSKFGAGAGVPITGWRVRSDDKSNHEIPWQPIHGQSHYVTTDLGDSMRSKDVPNSYFQDAQIWHGQPMSAFVGVEYFKLGKAALSDAIIVTTPDAEFPKVNETPSSRLELTFAEGSLGPSGTWQAKKVEGSLTLNRSAAGGRNYVLPKWSDNPGYRSSTGYSIPIPTYKRQHGNVQEIAITDSNGTRRLLAHQWPPGIKLERSSTMLGGNTVGGLFNISAASLNDVTRLDIFVYYLPSNH